MKKIFTDTVYIPLKLIEDNEYFPFKGKDGKRIEFRDPFGVELFCAKNHCAYVKQTNTFYE